MARKPKSSSSPSATAPLAAPPIGAWPADRVERRPLAALVPYARNARTHTPAQVIQLAEAIREWGWTMPVLVDEEGGIIAGHGRVLAAARLELSEVPVTVARGWSEAQKRAYVIADNRLALLSDWDDGLLKLELGELRTAGFNLNLAGFEGNVLDKLLAPVVAPEAFPAFGEDIETEHKCPKCGYVWSGKAA